MPVSPDKTKTSVQVTSTNLADAINAAQAAQAVGLIQSFTVDPASTGTLNIIIHPLNANIVVEKTSTVYAAQVTAFFTKKGHTVV